MDDAVIWGNLIIYRRINLRIYSLKKLNYQKDEINIIWTHVYVF